MTRNNDPLDNNTESNSRNIGFPYLAQPRVQMPFLNRVNYASRRKMNKLQKFMKMIGVISCIVYCSLITINVYLIVQSKDDKYLQHKKSNTIDPECLTATTELQEWIIVGLYSIIAFLFALLLFSSQVTLKYQTFLLIWLLISTGISMGILAELEVNYKDSMLDLLYVSWLGDGFAFLANIIVIVYKTKEQHTLKKKIANG